jgi:toxin FitB
LITVDSSGWIEYFSDGPLAPAYEKYLLSPPEAIATPTIVLFEVYRLIKRERGEEEAMLAAGQIAQTRLVPLDESLALYAADLALEHRLALADSIVYATSRVHDAELITSDADFERLPGVRYLKKAAQRR